MKIGILQTGRAPDDLKADHGDYDGMFERLLGGRNFEFVTWPVLDGVFPDSVTEADGWLITGSRFGAYEDHDWIPPLEDFIRECHGRKIPLVGICFGHQVIAQALGGKVEKYRDGWSVGREYYRLDGFDDPVELMAWHQDQVTELPPGAEVAGSTPFCRYAALTYGDHVYTIQPHPEFSPGFLGDLLVSRGKVLPAGIADAARKTLSGDTGSGDIADLISDVFLRHDH